MGCINWDSNEHIATKARLLRNVRANRFVRARALPPRASEASPDGVPVAINRVIVDARRLSREAQSEPRRRDLIPDLPG